MIGVGALLREEIDNQEIPEKEFLQLDNLIIDFNRREVKFDNTTVFLKPKEYDLLLFLVKNKGQVLSRELILERVGVENLVAAAVQLTFTYVGFARKSRWILRTQYG